MDDHSYPRRTRSLLALLVLAAIYGLWFHQQQALSGDRTVDGTFSVILGLYICSRPAGNAIDLIFIERRRFHRLVTESSSLQWLALKFFDPAGGLVCNLSGNFSSNQPGRLMASWQIGRAQPAIILSCPDI